MEQEEKEVIAGYTVQTSLWIGDKRLIYARSDNPQEPHPYMKCISTQNGLLTEYTDALCSDRYEEIMKRFAEDIRAEAVRLEAEKSAKGDAVAPCFGKGDVEPAPYDRSIKGRVVALKPDALDDSYKYPFSDQVCIYAQKPDAVACAEIAIWNRLDRWVNRGAHGIALIRDNGGRPVLSHVFDVADTHSRRPFELWTMENGMEPAITEAMENRFGELSEKRSFPAAVLSAVGNLCEDSLGDYLDNLAAVTHGSLLAEYDADSLRARFLPILKNSVAFTVLTRAGYHAPSYVDAEALHGVYEFSTPDTVNCLGTATADLSEICLREVEKVVKAEKRRTVDEKTKMGYHEGAEEKQKNGGMNHGSYENDLSGSGNGDAPEPETAGEPSPGDREIRHGTPGVSDGAPEGDLYDLIDREPSGGTPLGDRPDSTGSGAADDRADGEGPWGERTDESRASDALDTGDEQHQSVGGGNHSASVDRGVSGQETDQITERKNEPAQSESAFSVPDYDLHLGTVVYIGKNECEITAMDGARVELFDGTLIPLELETGAFLRRLRENPLNDRLRIGYVPQPVITPPKPSSGRSRKRRSEEPTVESLTAELERDYARWDDLLENGGSDPTWADGVNMNLVQGRIVANRRILTELCGNASRHSGTGGTARDAERLYGKTGRHPAGGAAFAGGLSLQPNLPVVCGAGGKDSCGNAERECDSDHPWLCQRAGDFYPGG